MRKSMTFEPGAPPMKIFFDRMLYSTTDSIRLCIYDKHGYTRHDCVMIALCKVIERIVHHLLTFPNPTILENILFPRGRQKKGSLLHLQHKMCTSLSTV